MLESLNEIDPVYANVIHHMSVAERIAYCEQLIDKTQSFLANNNKFLGQEIKQKNLEIISRSQGELRKLIKMT